MSNPIRVLHVFGRLDRGGAETMIMNLYRNIDRTKIQFDFVKHTEELCDYEGEIKGLGGKIFSLPRYTGKNHIFYKKRWDKLLNKNPQYKIIHGHLRTTAAIYLKIAKKYGLITIAHSHSTASRGNLLEKKIKDIMQISIKYYADYMFACSEAAGKWLFGKDVTLKANYKCFNNAICIEKYRFDNFARAQMRAELGIQDKFVIGHVGSFTYPKNHTFLIRIFNEIQKYNNEAFLLMVGEGQLKNKIENEIKFLKLQDKVIFTGNIQNVNDYLNIMDVLVFPSIYEGLPVSIIEAQANGLPCVISDLITKEVKITNLVEFFSIKKEPLEWVNLINTLKRDENTDYINGMIKSDYNIKNLAKWYENFIRSLLLE
jgi:glycosyltransferase involved in cell wall biosynthesis